MENTIHQQLEELNKLSENMIRDSYLAGHCRSIWIVGQDDGMDLD